MYICCRFDKIMRMFHLIICTVIILLALANVYFYSRLIAYLPPLHWTARTGIALLFFLLSVSYIIAMLLRHSDAPDWIMNLLLTAGSVWLIFMLYVVISLLACDLMRCFVPKFHHCVPLAVTATVVLMAYGYWNAMNPRITNVDIPLKGWKHKGSLTVVGISDIHLGDETGKKDLARYVDMINDLKPQLILIAGDLIDSNLYPLVRDNMAVDLERLYAPMGVFMVPGNHEYISNIHEVEKYLKQTGIRFMLDSVVSFPEGISLVGRDDRTNRRRLPLESLMFVAGKEMPVIVMDHQPTEISVADSLGADMVFCGHTHRGQVWPLNWLTDFIYEQSHGYERYKNSQAYVSQGLSLWGPPFRIGSKSEIVVFHLHPQD